VDVTNVRATIACQATATARYVFDGAALANMKSACAGKTLAEVTNYVGALTGVRPGSVSLSFSPGNANRVPKDASAIAIQVA
jgi:hypothetical protein